MTLRMHSFKGMDESCHAISFQEQIQILIEMTPGLIGRNGVEYRRSSRAAESGGKAVTESDCRWRKDVVRLG